MLTINNQSIIILGALDSEIAPLKNRMSIRKEEHQPKSSFYWGEYFDRKILLIRAGVGKKNTLRALKSIQTEGIRFLINIGLAGGVACYLKVGDVVVSQVVRNTIPAHQGYEADPYLLNKIDQLVNSNLFKVTMITGNSLCSKKEKEKLREKYDHVAAVDMESFYIGQYCTEQQIPFISLRAICDTFDFKFPSYCLIKDRFYLSDYPKIIKTIICKPHELLSASILKYNCKIAVKRNFELLSKYLDILS